jgi:hypothetical protein
MEKITKIKVVDLDENYNFLIDDLSFKIICGLKLCLKFL